MSAEPVSAPLFAALKAAEAERAITPTSEALAWSKVHTGLSDADCQEIDMAMHRHKQPRPSQPLVDGYEADRQAKAVSIQLGSRRFT